jgi:histidyl-tRNA synthetase
VKEELLRPVRGMSDVPPSRARRLRQVEDAAIAAMRRFGYREIRTPILEKTALFARPLGEHSDLVEKEMFTFNSNNDDDGDDGKGGEKVSLRPEATVSVARALLAQGIGRGGVARMFYAGAMFRRERPQRGRYRQFHQFGAEVVGSGDAEADAELITMCRDLWRDLQIGDALDLQINNLGEAAERARHREKLADYFRRYADDLDADSRRRIDKNPLRILDSKEPRTKEIAANAPRLADELGADSRRFVDEVRAKLAAAGIAAKENPALVRGLDYYNLTVFEWTRKNDARAQNAVCGGGRYDGLTAQIGGGDKKIPACGFAAGIERVAELIAEEHGGDEMDAPDVYLVVGAEGGDKDEKIARHAAVVADALRAAGLDVFRNLDGGNISRQLHRASIKRVKIAIIVGEDEAAQNAATIKFMGEKAPPDSRQIRAPLADLAAAARKMI